MRPSEKKEPEKKKKLTTKEDYLAKMLEGVELLRLIQDQNTRQNEIIEEYIQSLIEQMTPEQSESEEGKEEEQGEASEKKPSEKQEKQEQKKEDQAGTSPEQLDQDSGGTEAKESAKPATAKEKAAKSALSTRFKSEIKKKLIYEEIVSFTKAQREMEKLATSLKKAMTEHSGEKAERGGAADSDIRIGADVDPYTGGEAKSRNRAVKKTKTGLLQAKKR